MYSIRGATTVDLNDKEQILNATKEMVLEITSKNNLDPNDIISIIFTSTKDLDVTYPAIAARELGITYAALMCINEMYVVGSLEKCIRVMVTAHGDKKQNEVKHIYLKAAKTLRPDLLSNTVDNLEAK